MSLCSGAIHPVRIKSAPKVRELVVKSCLHRYLALLARTNQLLKLENRLQNHFLENLNSIIVFMFFWLVFELTKSLSFKQQWQFGRTVRSELAYYVPRTFNRTAPADRTLVQFLKSTVPTFAYVSCLRTVRFLRTVLSINLVKQRSIMTYATYGDVLFVYIWFVLYGKISLRQRFLKE